MPELDYKLFLTSTTPHLDRQNSRQNHQNTAPHTLSVWNPPREKRPSWSTAVVRPFSSVFVCFRSSGFVCFTCCDRVSFFRFRRRFLPVVPAGLSSFLLRSPLLTTVFRSQPLVPSFRPPPQWFFLPKFSSQVLPPRFFLPGFSLLFIPSFSLLFIPGFSLLFIPSFLFFFQFVAAFKVF